MIKNFTRLLVLVCSLLIAPNCFAQTKIVLNNMNNFDIGSAVLKNNYYYIPAKSLAFIANAHYTWNSKQKTLTLLWRTHEINFTLDSTCVLYDGTELKIKSAPFIEEGQFYIPISVVPDLFSGKVFYNKERDILKLYWEIKDTKISTSNPFEAINKMSEIDAINYYSIANDKSIRIINKEQITSILNEYFNNAYTRIDYSDQRTMGYKYYLDLYSEGEKIARIWVIDHDFISLNHDFISLNHDTGYYRLKIPLTYNF